MSRKTTVFLMVTTCVLLFAFSAAAQEERMDKAPEAEAERLAVLWTSGDSEVAEKLCFMYVYNADKYKWFDEVRMIVWGPSARLLAGDTNLQEGVKKMIDAGIKVEACVVCADMYGVSDQFRAMGIDVKGMGVPLSNYLKAGWRVLTF